MDGEAIQNPAFWCGNTANIRKEKLDCFASLAMTMERLGFSAACQLYFRFPLNLRLIEDVPQAL